MNKTDISLLKKNLDDDNERLTVNGVLTSVIHNGELLYKDTREWFSYSQPECEEILTILRKTLSGKLGKCVNEYEFDFDGEDHEMQQFLIELNKSKFSDEELNDKFIEKVADTVTINGAYSLFCISYTISTFDKHSEENVDLSFIAAAICPIKLRVDGLIYNDLENIIEKRNQNDRVLDKPCDGFLFPTVSDVEQDVNHALYYTKNANSPNLTIVQELLGLKYTLTAERQRVNFWGMTAKLLEDDLTYDKVISINERLSDLAAASGSEPREIDCADMQDILSRSGVSDETLDKLGHIYEEVMGSRKIVMIASNLCDDKVGIKNGNTSINIDYKRAASHIDVRMLDGRKCIVIPVDTSDLSVLGIDTKI